MPLLPTLTGLSKLCTHPLPAFCKVMCKVGFTPHSMLASADHFPEFMPYVFQLFAALLEANPSANLPGYYQELIAPVLMPVMWESRGNTPALVRLLSSIISRGSQYILEHNQLEPILGIFQKLISTKANEGYAFDLLESVAMNFPP